MNSNNATVPGSKLIGALVYLLLFPVILLFLGGDRRWIEGWVFSLIAMGLVLIVTIAVRSLGEEAMLKQELEGYSDYMRKVKWRMIPYVF
jgi:protein-S-isoprenylcysteine O-methyltransferase Ste14